jgi:hypothetical protein
MTARPDNAPDAADIVAAVRDKSCIVNLYDAEIALPENIWYACAIS